MMKNKRCKFGACALLLTLFGIQNALPQGYVKLNGLYGAGRDRQPGPS